MLVPLELCAVADKVPSPVIAKPLPIFTPPMVAVVAVDKLMFSVFVPSLKLADNPTLGVIFNVSFKLKDPALDPVLMPSVAV
jgi:hypothetical protein